MYLYIMEWSHENIIIFLVMGKLGLEGTSFLFVIKINMP